MIRIFHFFKFNYSKLNNSPVMLGRWNLKHDERAEYISASNANRDNCFKNYNKCIEKSDYTLDELVVLSHIHSFPENNIK